MKKIGILQTAYKKATDYGAFYNVQELGLARALARQEYEVILYKAVDGESQTYEEEIDTIQQDGGKLTVNLCATHYLGINGIFDVRLLDKDLDTLIYFSDTQISVLRVYKWCKKNNVQFVPYVGVIESHSENPLNKVLMKYVAKRNITIYRKVMTLAKTPDMMKKLADLDCTNVKLFPVGLDETVMNREERTDGICGNEKCSKIHNLLFIGRMEEEKQPLEMVRLYDELLTLNDSVSLTMIGDGHLYEQILNALKDVCSKHEIIFNKKIAAESFENLNYCDCDNQLKAGVNNDWSSNNPMSGDTSDNLQIDLTKAKGTCILLRKVPYSEMYKFYRNADVYINLNKVEILGMSILEAMYYRCLVVAVEAPGPDFILRDNKNQQENYYGMIAPDMEALEEVLKLLVKGEIEQEEISQITEEADIQVRENFMWDSLVYKLEDYLKLRD